MEFVRPALNTLLEFRGTLEIAPWSAGILRAWARSLQLATEELNGIFPFFAVKLRSVSVVK